MLTFKKTEVNIDDDIILSNNKKIVYVSDIK